MNVNSMKNGFGFVARLATSGLLSLTLLSCGGGGGSAGTVPNAQPPADPATVVGSVKLVFSSPELKSAGTSGSEVTVTALVRNSTNNAMEGVPVSFTTDSGILTGVDTTTDQNGQAKAKLGIAGDNTNRTITVSVVAGASTSTAGKTDEGTVNVVGTTITSVGPSSIALNAIGDYTITVKDSSGAAVTNQPLTFTSAQGNPITVKSSSTIGGTATAPWTNSQGQVVLRLTASQAGNDVLTFSAQGATAVQKLTVNAASLTVKVVDGSGNEVSEASTTTSCEKIVAHYEINNIPQAGTVNLSTSRGTLYSDSACTTQRSSSSVPVVAGDSQATYLQSNTAGVATVTAAIGGGPSTQTNVEFIAALTASATISLQVDPAVIGTNSGTGQSEQSTLTAVVRDGTTYNNFVKDAVVEFTILQDKSGGALSNPSVVTTASNGSATVAFIAGTADTPSDGVQIQARIQGTTTTVTKTLTVSRKSLFVSAGTGNKLGTPSNTTYQLDYSVFVTDASGNPVPNATVTATVIPVTYAKGTYTYSGGWVFADPYYVCDNEDRLNYNGILDAGEDYNSNGKLDPGIPFSVTPSVTTDATGTGVISILYPRDRGNWTYVKLTVTGSVSGTESTYQTQFTLPVLAADFSSTSAPPGMPSPYGVNPCNVPD